MLSPEYSQVQVLQAVTSLVEDFVRPLPAGTKTCAIRVLQYHREQLLADLREAQSQGQFLDSNALSINYFELPYDDKFQWRRDCPVCSDGLLLIGRDRDTLEIERKDRCTLCAQQFIFLDLDKMRAVDCGQMTFDDAVPVSGDH